MCGSRVWGVVGGWAAPAPAPRLHSCTRHGLDAPAASMQQAPPAGLVASPPRCARLGRQVGGPAAAVAALVVRHAIQHRQLAVQLRHARQ